MNATNIQEDKIRFAHDFEYWCMKCVKIQDKITGQRIPFILNRPQKKLLALLESQRQQNKPIRVILLKSRQWGGSTLVQLYIAWFQLVLFKGKNSVIIGHKRNTSFLIKNMLRTVIDNYPTQYLDNPDEPLKLINVRDGNDIQEISSREAKILITSSYSPDAIRGFNLSFAHLSEVAFWQANRNIDPTDLIRSVNGTIPLLPNTIVVLESTANGNNSYFYNEWQRAIQGNSLFTPLFVGWQEIEMYSKPIDSNYSGIVLSDYENALLQQGLTKPQIYWYHEKLKEFPEHDLMKAEFPTTPDEAFVSSTHYVFSAGEQSAINTNAAPPATIEDNLKIWQQPQRNNSGSKFNYIATLTIGSTIGEEKDTILSLWHIVSTAGDSYRLELAAQLNEKVPLNLMAKRVLPICEKYNQALLIIANNNLDSKVYNHGNADFVLDNDFNQYKRLYYDTKKQKKYLNVDRDTYSLMFYELIVNEKNQLFVDRDPEACQAIAGMVIHDNQKFYISYEQDFNYVLNRAELLYVWRNITMKNHRVISESDKKMLLH